MRPIEPDTKFNDLNHNTRMLVLSILREYCRETGIFYALHENGMGQEEIEEDLIALLNEGTIKIFYDIQKDGSFRFNICFWDGKKYVA